MMNIYCIQCLVEMTEAVVHFYSCRQTYLMRCNALYVPSSKTTVTEYQISREVIWYGA